MISKGRSIGQKIGSGTAKSHRECQRNEPGPEWRRAGLGHDGPRLGARHETRIGNRHKSRRPNLPRGDYCTRTRYSCRRRLWRCDGNDLLMARLSRSAVPKVTRLCLRRQTGVRENQNRTRLAARHSRQDHDERWQPGSGTSISPTFPIMASASHAWNSLSIA